MIGEVLESLMLVCFAVSWPFNIRASYRARTAIGKSIVFEAVIQVGYLCGVARKFVIDQLDFVLFFYFLDMFLVAIDMSLYFRNRKLDRQREEKRKQQVE